jgi:hypothetical protein
MNQGTRWVLLMQKNCHRKSHAWAPLTKHNLQSQRLGFLRGLAENIYQPPHGLIPFNLNHAVHLTLPFISLLSPLSPLELLNLSYQPPIILSSTWEPYNYRMSDSSSNRYYLYQQIPNFQYSFLSITHKNILGHLTSLWLIRTEKAQLCYYSFYTAQYK